MTRSNKDTEHHLQYWLIKSEPSEFSIDDLKKKECHHWDGVRNFEARNFMRDDMREGDLVLFYHSNAKPSGVAGIAKVVRRAYPDFTAWNKKSKYFDKRSREEKPLWFMVDIAFIKRFPRTIDRSELKRIPALKDMILWKRNRLSITPVTKKEFETIREFGLSI